MGSLALLFTIASASASASALAVTPLGPGFDRTTRALVSQRLEQAQVPAVGHNSVVIAILVTLGAEPHVARFAYDEPYPHLPTVHVDGRLQERDCVSISADVEGAADAGYSKVQATGVFCLVGRAQWRSTDFTAKRADDRRGAGGHALRSRP